MISPRAELLKQAIEAEAQGDFEAARTLREAAKQLDAEAVNQTAALLAESIPEHVVGQDHLGVHVWVSGTCCPSAANASSAADALIGPGAGLPRTCIPKPASGPIRELRIVLDSYPPKCGVCRKPLYIVRWHQR